MGTARLLSGVMAEYQNEDGEKYREVQKMKIGCVKVILHFCGIRATSNFLTTSTVVASPS